MEFAFYGLGCVGPMEEGARLGSGVAGGKEVGHCDWSACRLGRGPIFVWGEGNPSRDISEEERYRFLDLFCMKNEDNNKELSKIFSLL